MLIQLEKWRITSNDDEVDGAEVGAVVVWNSVTWSLTVYEKPAFPPVFHIASSF